MGIGIDTAVASADEVGIAVESQKKIDATKVKALKKSIENNRITENCVTEVLTKYGYEKIEDIQVGDYKKVCDDLQQYANSIPVQVEQVIRR